MACGDDCEGEIPIERPTLWASGPAQVSALSWILIVAGFAAGWTAAPSGVATSLFAAAIVSGAFFLAREAVEELVKEREVGIELLMTVAIAGAAILGNWREAALVAALFSITEALEGFTIQRTRHAIRGLMDLVPPKARILRDGGETKVDVKEVCPGDRIRVEGSEVLIILNGLRAALP